MTEIVRFILLSKRKGKSLEFFISTYTEKHISFWPRLSFLNMHFIVCVHVCCQFIPKNTDCKMTLQFIKN